MPPELDILIPAHNRLTECRACIESLRDQPGGPYRLILVDNASTDGVGAYFDTLDGAEVIHLDDNAGFAGAVNAGLARARGHVLLLNSDTVMPRGALMRLRAALMSSPDWGLIGPVSNCAPGLQQIDDPHAGDLSMLETFAKLRAESFGVRIDEAYRITGFCMLVRDCVVREVGLFDESYRIGTYEDFDYCVRTVQAGYRIGIAQGVFVYHHGSRTFQGMGITGARFDALLAENEQRFFSKWGATAMVLTDGARVACDYVARAREAVERGRVVDAVRLLAQAIESFPYSTAAFNDLGVLLWKQGAVEKAYTYLEHAVELNPHYQLAVDNWIEVASVLGRAGEARDLCDRWRNAPKPWRLRR